MVESVTGRGNSGRTPLTRDRALREAIALADAEGLDAVSMRNLATRLGVVPMALYKHVANKDDLLGGMVDTLIAEYAESTPRGTSWRDGIRATILSARATLVRHPWSRRLIESRTARTPAVLGYMDALAGRFIAGGFSADLTHHVMHVLGHRIWGFSPEAFNDPGPAGPPAPDPAPEQQAGLVEQMRAVYPHITAIALAAAGGDPANLARGCDEDFEFTFALGLLLDAFDRLRAQGWTSPDMQTARPD